jgi:high affinity Mn2+ porin
VKGLFLHVAALGVLLLGSVVQAADTQTAQTASDRPNYNWNGFYLGGHVGYGRAYGDVFVRDPIAMNTSPSLGSLFGGLQFGYNYLLPSRVMIGIEADISMPNSYPSDAEIWAGTTSRSVLVEQLDYIATLRGRFGYAFDKTLLYATGGVCCL